MRSRHLTKELAPHLARPHKLRAEPIDPETKGFVEEGDREANMISATHLDVRVFRHAGRPSVKVVNLLQRVTGAPYAATAAALTPVTAHVLEKEAIAAAIRSSPALAAELEELARRGQAALAGDAVAHHEDQLAHPELIMARMRGFLRDLALRPPA